MLGHEETRDWLNQGRAVLESVTLLIVAPRTCNQFRVQSAIPNQTYVMPLYLVFFGFVAPDHRSHPIKTGKKPLLDLLK